MKQNQHKETALQLASQKGDQQIVIMLLNVFSEDQNEKLIEFVMRENVFQETVLHHGCQKGYEEIVKLFLNVFSYENEQLIEYVMKENQQQKNALNYASENGHEKIVTLLSQKLANAENKKILCDLQKITQMFKNQGTEQKKISM